MLLLLCLINEELFFRLEGDAFENRLDKWSGVERRLFASAAD